MAQLDGTLPCVRCAAPAKLQCPKCLELALPKESAVFCTQDCFKQAWGEHKKVHASTEWLYCLKRGKGRTNTTPVFAWTGPLRPERIGPARQVPSHIPRPDYASTGIPQKEIDSKKQNIVPVYSEEEIAGIRKACQLGRKVLDEAHRHIRPGATTDEIDRVVHETTIAAGAYPSPLNYFNFPKSVCTSVNEVICHGIPDKRVLQSGDIVNVDVSVYLDGFHGDLNETFVVGDVDERSKQLVKVAHDCLMHAVALCKAGARFKDVGEVISKHADANGFSVVRSYCGHGIGDLFHCAPNVPHYAPNRAVGKMKEGNIFTIEPMINAGGWRDETWPDGWTSVTRDGQRSAQFEHQLLITKNGVEVLTARTPDSPPLWWETPVQPVQENGGQSTNGDAAKA